ILELTGAIRDALLEVLAVALEIFEHARIRHGRGNLVRELSDEVQVGFGLRIGTRVLHAEEPDHHPVLDQRRRQQRAGFLVGAFDSLTKRRRRATPVLAQPPLRILDDPSEEARSEWFAPGWQALAIAFVHAQIERAVLAIDEHEIEL